MMEHVCSCRFSKQTLRLYILKHFFLAFRAFPMPPLLFTFAPVRTKSEMASAAASASQVGCSPSLYRWGTACGLRSWHPLFNMIISTVAMIFSCKTCRK